jgi:hypothetical protein
VLREGEHSAYKIGEGISLGKITWWAGLRTRTHLYNPHRDEYSKYLWSEEWQAKRRLALDAAGGRCCRCRRRDQLQVHHKTYERVCHEEPSDLLVLCRDCHAKEHGIKVGERRGPKKASKKHKHGGSGDRTPNHKRDEARRRGHIRVKHN